jgi:hypothetical protein
MSKSEKLGHCLVKMVYKSLIRDLNLQIFNYHRKIMRDITKVIKNMIK